MFTSKLRKCRIPSSENQFLSSISNRNFNFNRNCSIIAMLCYAMAQAVGLISLSRDFALLGYTILTRTKKKRKKGRGGVRRGTQSPAPD